MVVVIVVVVVVIVLVVVINFMIVRSNVLVAMDIMQAVHPPVQAEAVACLQQLHMFAPKHLDLGNLVPRSVQSKSIISK